MAADPVASAVGVVAAGVETEGILMQRQSLTMRMTSRRSSSRRHEKDQLDKEWLFQFPKTCCVIDISAEHGLIMIHKRINFPVLHTILPQQVL